MSTYFSAHRPTDMQTWLSTQLLGLLQEKTQPRVTIGRHVTVPYCSFAPSFL